MPLILGFSEKRNFNTPYVNPTLKIYVDEYLKDMTNNGIDVSAYYQLDSIKIVSATCVICNNYDAVGCYEDTKKLVSIKEPYNDNSKDPDMYYRYTVYHELGHAVLKLPHNTFRFSIMNSTEILPMRIYRDIFPKLVNEYSDYYKIIKELKDDCF